MIGKKNIHTYILSAQRFDDYVSTQSTQSKYDNPSCHAATPYRLLASLYSKSVWDAEFLSVGLESLQDLMCGISFHKGCEIDDVRVKKKQRT